MWFEYLRIAGKVLRGHKFRSLLTMLSITIGAFSIVIMTSLAQSGLATLARGIEDLGGARLVSINAKVPERMEDKLSSYFRGITVADRDLLFSALPQVVERSMFSSLDRKDLAGDSGTSTRSDVVAADGGFLSLFRMHLAKGRGFTEEENRQHAKVCVVGHELAQKLWGGDAMGRWLVLGSLRCRVIGQLANQDRWGVHFGFDWLDLAVVPLITYADHEPAAAKAVEVLLKTDDPASNELVKRIVNALLVERHHGVDDFQIFDFSRFMDKFNGIFSIMEAIVGVIAGIALLVGGVGVMNMMLVSVSERVREIGIRKALGASPRDIGAQFLWEAIVLSGTGGLIGVLAGIAGAIGSASLIRHFKPTWVGVVAFGAVSIALLVSLAIGIVFGYFPARRAGRLDAIEAIRR